MAVRTKFRGEPSRTRWVSEIIDELKSLLNLSTDQKLAEKIGVAQSTIPSWKLHNRIPHALIIDLAQRYNFSLDEIFLERHPIEKWWTLPALAMPESEEGGILPVAQNDPGEVAEATTSDFYLIARKNLRDTEVFEANDNIMAPTIEPGDLVLIEQVDEVSIPGIYVVIIGGGRDGTLRRILPIAKDKYQVSCDNTNYPPIVTTGDGFLVYGRALKVLKSV